MDISLFHSKIWTPLARFGFTHTLFELNAETITYTWIGLVALTIIALLGRWALYYPTTVGGYITLSILKNFKSMVEQSVGFFVARYFFFVTGLFLFIFTCNALVLLPGLEEPTKDVNTTLALALVSFFYTQKETLLAHGLAGYIADYCAMPFTLFPSGRITITALPGAFLRLLGNIGTTAFTLPLEILGKLAKIISLSLRLFGNIFGGAVITTLFRTATSGSMMTSVMTWLASFNIGVAALASPLLILFVMLISLVVSFFFGLFESFIQAFVFSVLSLTYLAFDTRVSEEHHNNPQEHHS